jgi:NAD(P)H-flavin reductase
MKELRPGDWIGVRGPFGTAWPVDDLAGYDILVMAGGIGLAPLRPAIHRILARRMRYGNVVLLYGARTPADILYRKELQRWRGMFDFQVEVTVDRAERDWLGHVGVVTTLLEQARCDFAQTAALVCGPEIMMRFAVRELLDRGVSEERIFLSMERNMKCGIGICGHCQVGPEFVCKDGPVFAYPRVRDILGRSEL